MIFHSMKLVFRITPEERIPIVSLWGLLLMGCGKLMDSCPVGWEA